MEFWKTKKTPLQQAAFDGNVDEIHRLIDRGDNVNGKNGEDDATPLHWAAVANQCKAALALINRGADLHACDKKGRIPYQLAVEHGEDSEIARVLREAMEKQGG